jgi:hypothetical protein
MLKKSLSFAFCVVLLGNGFGSLAYAQSGRVSARRDGTRNSLAQRGNTSSGYKSEVAKVSSTTAPGEKGKAISDVRGVTGQNSQGNSLSKGDRNAAIALLSYAILMAVVTVSSGP